MSPNIILSKVAATVLLVVTVLISHVDASEETVVAFRGASRQLPENSLSSFALAVAMGSDYISMDLVMTKDNHLVVFRDIHVTDKTNVAEIYPGRARQDGRYYIIDFTLTELQQLRIIPESDEHPASLRIPTFSDTLLLLRQLEKVHGKTIGIAPEIKKPWFHLSMGKDISSATLDMLQRFNYTEPGAPVFLQCYDPEELQRIHKTLMVAREIDLKLVQLIDSNDGSETQRLQRGKWLPYNFEWMFTRLGTKLLALYADAIGIGQNRLLTEAEDPVFSHFLTGIQVERIKIHALSLANMAKDSPGHFESYTDLITRIYEQINIDVFVTDSPDLTLAFLKKREAGAETTIPILKQPLYPPTLLKD